MMFLDSSAILNGCLNIYQDIYISPLVITELENIKTSLNKSDKVKFLARQAVREILNSSTIQTYPLSQKKVEKLLNKYKFLSNINDHRLLCEALLLAKKQQISFVTSDGALYIFAKQFPQLNAIYYDDFKENQKDEYCGWGKYYPDDATFVSLYSHPEKNILNLKINEFAEIYEGNELKDILFWDGFKYNNLKYKDIKDKTLGEEIKPLNTEQKMAFHLLQDTDIPVKLLIGNPGTGKDILMIMHAIDLIQRGIMDKIIFIRNLVPFKDAPEIGFLSGDLNEKISWGLGPLRSILGEEGLKMYEENGLIEAVNLGFIRGCSWDRTIIYVSEGQNISGGGYKLLVSRCGKGSQLWVNGDILQTDDKKFETNNGLDRLINSLAGNPLFGMVKLIKTERSEVAELAAKI